MNTPLRTLLYELKNEYKEQPAFLFVEEGRVKAVSYEKFLQDILSQSSSALARQILDLIEDICDQMEYEGSRMFDEYMDRTMLLAMVDKIYDKIDHQEKQDCQKKEQLLYQMILSLLGGEIYHRRCRYRRKRNMFKA